MEKRKENVDIAGERKDWIFELAKDDPAAMDELIQVQQMLNEKLESIDIRATEIDQSDKTEEQKTAERKILSDEYRVAKAEADEAEHHLLVKMVQNKQNILAERKAEHKALQEQNEKLQERRKSLIKDLQTLGKKIYPNDPCPCGSGKKFKKCCGQL